MLQRLRNWLFPRTVDGRSFREQQAFVLCFIDKAREIDPGAFPPGCVVQWWPEISDPRQRAALDAALEYRA